MNDTTTENALLIRSIDEVALAFQSKETLEAMISKIEDECRAEHHTVATREGRDRLKSIAYKISRSKTAIDEVGKGLTEEARKLIENTNGLRKIATGRLDALKDEIRAPLTKWEEAEDARKQVIKDRINMEFGPRALPTTSAALRAIQDRTVAIELDDTFGEFVADAAKAKDAFLRNLSGKIQEAVREEEREAELARLREAKAKRAEEDAARAKAEEEARKRDAEARANLERERAALEAEREAMRKDAAAREEAQAEENARLRAELEAMKQQPLPEPVGVEVEVAPAEDPIAAFEPIALSGENFEVVAEIKPALSIERQIAIAVIEILRQCHTHAAMADEVASAIVGGQIPHVEVVK